MTVKNRDAFPEIYKQADSLSEFTNNSTETQYFMGLPAGLRYSFLEERGETTRNNVEWLNLTWTSWNLDKHHIVKDSADVVVSWPWNKFMFIIARLTVSVLFWQAVPCYCFITSNMKVSTSSRMSSSVRKAPSCDAWSIKSRQARRLFTPIKRTHQCQYYHHYHHVKMINLLTRLN